MDLAKIVPAKPDPQIISVDLTHNQSIRNREPKQKFSKSNILSSLQFNDEGNLLAVGDRGGNIKVLKRASKHKGSDKLPLYELYVAFQSHQPELDYLKGTEIKPKILQLKWLKGNSKSDCILSSNDRTIKLWKIGDAVKPQYSVNPPQKFGCRQLLLPRRFEAAPVVTSTFRKSFTNGHMFPINSVSINSDYETFISSDDLRINLWSIDHTDQSFVIVDLKPKNMKSLGEVITTCAFHPKSCNIFSYSTSRGITNLCDMRINASCNKPQMQFKPDDSNYRGFFPEIVESVGHAQFSNSGNFIATRDYLGVKMWDTRLDSKCFLQYQVQDYLKPNLSSMLEKDLIFDKFALSWSHNDRRIVTGSYSGIFSLFETGVENCLSKSMLFQISDEFKDARTQFFKGKRILPDRVKVERRIGEIRFDGLDVQQRVLFSNWHPNENLLAVTSSCTVYLLNEKRLLV